MPSLQQLTGRAKTLLARARRRYAFIDIVAGTFERFSADDAGSYAAGLTYYTFFSIFPLLLLAGSLLGYLTADDPELRRELIRKGVNTVPILRDAFKPDGIDAIIENRRNLALSGLVLALYSGSGAVVALEHALNKLHKVEQEPGFMSKRLRSLKWLAILGVLSVAALGAGSVAGFAEEVLGRGPLVTVLVTVVAVGLAVAVNTLVFATAYRFLPAVRHSWRQVLPGAVVAAVLFQGLNIGGTAYLARGETARNDTFGTFAAAATLLVASYLISQITLLAAEVNLVLADRSGAGTTDDVDRGGDDGSITNE
ncbi:MAG: YihY/virulence factor BrkB family protein [Actinomycetota bacterium]|nr:YihY/virulence factor BrkB family protein [Actinomycetota bacterium]